MRIKDVMTTNVKEIASTDPTLTRGTPVPTIRQSGLASQ